MDFIFSSLGVLLILGFLLLIIHSISAMSFLLAYLFGPGGTLIIENYDGFGIGFIHGLLFIPDFVYWIFLDRPLMGADSNLYTLTYVFGAACALWYYLYKIGQKYLSYVPAAPVKQNS